MRCSCRNHDEREKEAQTYATSPEKLGQGWRRSNLRSADEGQRQLDGRRALGSVDSPIEVIEDVWVDARRTYRHVTCAFSGGPRGPGVQGYMGYETYIYMTAGFVFHHRSRRPNKPLRTGVCTADNVIVPRRDRLAQGLLRRTGSGHTGGQKVRFGQNQSCWQGGEEAWDIA
ncbi:hypothetical protein GCM10009811_18370 [Nostocoides veronense]|uniref:Transposase n=1 Tax=Nostocoides veronense TaxID=330836 RepID=A0ABP4XVX4_9MICO